MELNQLEIAGTNGMNKSTTSRELRCNQGLI